ncbi:MAG: GntR family transcriptional regulator [Acidobacteria bacterium]|nr:GntR family transcriptional regulator [Acidobacteriota bacterium]
MTSIPDVKTPHKTKAEKEGEVDRVYRIIKAWLIECRLPPGEFVSEVDLARECNTSRTPVREACNRLSQDGWITRIRKKGYLVTPVSVRDLLQLYEYRKLLECFAAEKAAQVASPEQMETLARIIEVEQRSVVDVNEVVAANDLFHLGIAEIAGNQRVYNQLKLTLEYVHRLDRLSTQKSHGWISHCEILNALQARKPNEARQAMATHIDYARDRMLHLFAR